MTFFSFPNTTPSNPNQQHKENHFEQLTLGLDSNNGPPPTSPSKKSKKTHIILRGRYVEYLVEEIGKGKDGDDVIMIFVKAGDFEWSRNELEYPVDEERSITKGISVNIGLGFGDR